MVLSQKYITMHPLFKKWIFCSAFVTCLINTTTVRSQEVGSLLDLLDDEEETINYTTASFKANRVINLHSLENTARGVLDFRINHRFGFLNTGLYELFGLDRASVRLGFDLGVTDNFQIGIGRSGFEKTLDGYMKYRILRQSSGKKNMPITLSILATGGIRTERWSRIDVEYPFYARLNYAFQAIVGRKFSENFSLQLSPTIVHRNLVRTRAEANTVMALGTGFRYKLTKRVTFNGEYIYVLPNQLADGFNNSLSIGFDIETGGHVFQLHFTNSTPMIEHAFITQTTGDWMQGGIHFGFNISRVFTLWRPEVF
jgi:opacity protein-like surface antigen